MESQEWPFDQEKNVAALTTKQVLEDGLPVLVVVHYADECDWAFLCDTTDEEEDARVVAMKTVIDTDPSLYGVAELEPGWVAERADKDSPWEFFEDDENE